MNQARATELSRTKAAMSAAPLVPPGFQLVPGHGGTLNLTGQSTQARRRCPRRREVGSAPGGHQTGHGFSPAADDDLLAALNPVEQGTEGVLGLESPNLHHDLLLTI